MPIPVIGMGHSHILPSTRAIPVSHDGGRRPTHPVRSSSENRRARIAALEAELAQLRREQRDDDDGAWLRQLAAAVDLECCFSVGDLLEHARIDPALGAALAGLSAKQIGKRLGVLDGRELDGLRLVRIKENNAGWVWMIALPPRP